MTRVIFYFCLFCILLRNYLAVISTFSINAIEYFRNDDFGGIKECEILSVSYSFTFHAHIKVILDRVYFKSSLISKQIRIHSFDYVETTD